MAGQEQGAFVAPCFCALFLPAQAAERGNQAPSPAEQESMASALAPPPRLKPWTPNSPPTAITRDSATHHRLIEPSGFDSQYSELGNALRQMSFH